MYVHICQFIYTHPPCKENVSRQKGEYMKIPEFIRRKVLFSFLKTGNTEDTWCERWGTSRVKVKTDGAKAVEKPETVEQMCHRLK